MNAWTVFATLFAGIEGPIVGSVDGMVAAIAPAVAHTLIAALVVVVAWKMFRGAMGHGGGNMLTELEGEIILGGAVYLIVSQVTNYNTFVSDIFLTQLGQGISETISGASGAQPVTAGAFDKVWNEAYVAGLTVFRQLSWDDFGLQILVVLYWLIALIAVVIGFAIWLMSYVLLALLIGTGPIFVALAAIPATKAIFQRWVGSLIAATILQVLVVACLVILTQAESTIIGQIAANGSDNAVSQLQLLLGGIALFVVTALVLWQLPGTAQGLAGGLTFQASSLSRSMMQGIGITQTAVSAGAGAASSSIGGARQALSAAPGRSLSS